MNESRFGNLSVTTFTYAIRFGTNAKCRIEIANNINVLSDRECTQAQIPLTDTPFVNNLKFSFIIKSPNQIKQYTSLYSTFDICQYHFE